MQLPNESLLLEDYGVQVSTDRVCYSGADYRTVMLDQVATCSIGRAHQPWLALVGGVLLIAALLSGRVGEGAMVLCGLGSLGFFLAYFLTRTTSLRISTAGDAIAITRSGIDIERMKKLVDTIELARWTLLRREQARSAQAGAGSY